MKKAEKFLLFKFVPCILAFMVFYINSLAQTNNLVTLKCRNLDSTYYMVDALTDDSESFVIIEFHKTKKSIQKNSYMLIDLRCMSVLAEFKLNRFVYFYKSYFCYKSQLVVLNISSRTNLLLDVEQGKIIASLRTKNSPKGYTYTSDNERHFFNQIYMENKITLNNGYCIFFDDRQVEVVIELSQKE